MNAYGFPHILHCLVNCSRSVGTKGNIQYQLFAIFFYIAVYDIYRSCDPDNAVLFLILTIVVPLCYPILLFCCRKKELGMPPRRPVLPEDGQ